MLRFSILRLQSLTGYSNHHDHQEIILDHPPPGYEGPDPYSAYSNIHPEISSTGFGDLHPDVSSFESHDHHHQPDFTSFDHHHQPDITSFDHHHQPDITSFDHQHQPDITSFDHQHQPDTTSFDPPNHHHSDESSYGPPPSGYSDLISSGYTPGGTSPPAATQADSSKSSPTAGPYRRQKRQINMQHLGLETINWAEIAFQFLGVDTEGCRRRFTCELEFKAQGNPITKMAYSMIR